MSVPEESILFLQLADAFGNRQELAVYDRGGYCEAVLSVISLSGYTQSDLTLRILTGGEFADLIVKTLDPLISDDITTQVAAPCLDGEVIRIVIREQCERPIDLIVVNPDEITDSRVKRLRHTLEKKLLTERWVQRNARRFRPAIPR